MNRCCVCHKLSLRPCARSPRCRAWALARQRFEILTHVPEIPLRKSAGKFVVGWDWEKP